jgi:hypothetical protein
MQKDDQIAVGTVTVPTSSVDLSVFGAQEIRDVLKNKAHCLRAGFPPDHILITTFNEIRNHYLRRVGLSTYLSQMLGKLSTAQIRYCSLYAEDRHPIEVRSNGDCNQPVQRFIAKQFNSNDLPFVVEVQSETDPDRIEVRYL